MLLSAEQVTKLYGDRILLDRVSFSLDRGDKVGVIGVNGAGKSTLLRLLAGAEEPDGGAIVRESNVRLEYLMQDPAFEASRTVLEQVLLGLSENARALAEYEAKSILSRLGVRAFEQKMGRLSGGERRRAALGQRHGRLAGGVPACQKGRSGDGDPRPLFPGAGRPEHGGGGGRQAVPV